MKKVCIITATRAEYGLLRPLIFELKKNPNIETQIIATGTHLDKRYGYTLNEILNDGLKPNACIEIIENDTQTGILSTMANAIKKVGKELKKLNPYMVVLLGDRYEIFAVASACVILNIPIAHISGGDITYGAYDDMFRHSITKMSNLHFTSCEEYKNRVIQLGENPESVFNFGSLSIENIKNLTLLSKHQLNEELNIDLENTLLATFHPVTMENSTQKEQFSELLEALIEQKKYNVLFTRANADTNSSELNKILDEFVQIHPQKIKVVESLGVLKYLSAMKYCAGVIGNSSSGILETPSFRIPTINIGNRQKGRLQASSILNCEAKKDGILKALDKISSNKFKRILEKAKNPYEGENTARKIANEVEIFVNKFNKIKEFYDIEVK
jgi:UDP-hydrolysing UDP-N-acetyl-D-glucosamine 2-epimerase